MSEPALALVQSTNTLLDYSLTTAPAPLQVSRATSPSHGTITIVVSSSNPSDVELTSIEIDLVVGDPSSPEGDDLTEIGAGIAISVSDPAWQGTYPGKTDGRLFVKPLAGVPITIGDQGIAITITNIQVSTEPGTTKVTIRESAAVGANPPSLTTAVLAVAKFPVGFSAGGFSIAKPVVPHGTGATLTWYGTQGTGITYQILWTGAPADVSTVQTWTSPALTDTTTFILQVTASTPNGPVQLMFPATQIVSDPDLVATSVHVLGPSALDGPVTTSTLTAGALSAGTVGVTTSATLTGSVDATAASLAALGPAIDIVSPSGAWDTLTYTIQPDTDGFVVGTVLPPPAYVFSNAVMTATANGITASANGGTMVASTSGGGMLTGPHFASLTVPVSKGTTAQVQVTQDPSNEQPAGCSLAFVPLGTATAAVTVQHRLDEPADLGSAVPFAIVGSTDDDRPDERRRQGPM